MAGVVGGGFAGPGAGGQLVWIAGGKGGEFSGAGSGGQVVGWAGGEGGRVAGAAGTAGPAGASRRGPLPSSWDGPARGRE